MAACCDRGVRHHRNEDATATAADPAPGSRAVLVVCDGVSTSIDSDVASLAGGMGGWLENGREVETEAAGVDGPRVVETEWAHAGAG